MADLSFLPDDDQDNQDEGLDCNTFKIIEDNVSVEYDKYTVVENFRRQFVGSVVSDALRDIRECPADVSVVADIVNKLANDTEVAVRAELMEQIPHIAMLYHNKRNNHHLINDTLLPLVTKFLADEDSQVRKTAQATLLVLVEQGLVETSVVEETVCPIIVTLTENDSLIEFQSGTVALMGKMAPLIGSSATEKVFLTRFAELCSSPTFATRQVCAANFGDFCAVIGSASAESILLDLNNLAAHLEQNMRIGEGSGGVHADICTASMAVVTDTDNKESRILGSSAQHSVIWVQPESTNAVTTHINCSEDTQQNWGQQLQDIVPQILVNQFVSMSDQSFAKAIDPELPHHCAFSIPAVALTLGRTNWNLIRKAYESLASDMQWKVRRTLACSIHELAVILGEDIATKDLVPIFNGFIKDLDEVRIGALKHLAEFLKFLRPQDRNSYLPRLQDFLFTDNSHNWRFRNELAEQLITAIPLFSPADTHKHISPLVISLLKDNVAHVRQVSVNLVTKLVNHIMVEQTLARGLLLHLIQQFAHSKQWIRRQTFALVCAQFLASGILDDEIFAADILPHLLDLSVDEVPNVRLVVARTLATNVMDNAESNPHYNVFVRVLQKLQWDSDRDVRSYAVQIH